MIFKRLRWLNRPIRPTFATILLYNMKIVLFEPVAAEGSNQGDDVVAIGSASVKNGC